MHRVLQVVAGEGGPLVVLLHGFAGFPEDLEPFARSLGVNGRFVFPEAPLDLRPSGLRGHAWWPSDGSGRQAARAAGIARDLSNFVPTELQAAHDSMTELLTQLRASSSHAPLVIGGFSQGAMLMFDVALRSELEIGAVVQLSGAPIASVLWEPRLAARAGTRAFISHGRQDDDLQFSVTERFEQRLRAAGWLVNFCPFDGGHEVPLVALRGLRKFLRSL